MKKVLLILLLFFAPLFATLKMLHAHYDISYAIFGVIGQSDARLVIDSDTQKYRIEINASARGIAKVMSNGRVESYESVGVVKDGLLVPQFFVTRTRKGAHFDQTDRYRFDHQAKKIVHLHQARRKGETKMKEEILPYYARDDILTLFFNLKKYVESGICSEKRCTLKAVGANDKDGSVDIEPARKKMLKVILHRRIFASKQGEIYIHLTEEGISDYALLKDVIFFGDVKAKATKIEHQ